MRSAARRRRDASATARSSSPTSRKRSASEPANPGWTLSEPGAIPNFATLDLGNKAASAARFCLCTRAPPRSENNVACSLETDPQSHKGVCMKTAKDVLKAIKDNDVKYVDLRFTDPRGKWQHVTFDVSMIDEEIFAEGTMFDGSSIAGWKAINESDMCLMPDPVTATIDPFFAETTMVIVCDVLEPTTGEPYNRDPRGIAKKAEAMVRSSG